MAKSLRSKPKLRAKSVKRKAEFSTFVNDRDQRLAEKMKANLEKQKLKAQQEASETAESTGTAENGENAMDEVKSAEAGGDNEQEATKPKKISLLDVSTGGRKRSSKDKYKKKNRAKSMTLRF